MAGSHVASSAHIPFHWISTLKVVHKAMINVTHPWEGTIRWLWSIAYCNQNKPNPTIFTATKKLEKAKRSWEAKLLRLTSCYWNLACKGAIRGRHIVVIIVKTPSWHRAAWCPFWISFERTMKLLPINVECDWSLLLKKTGLRNRN